LVASEGMTVLLGLLPCTLKQHSLVCRKVAEVCTTFVEAVVDILVVVIGDIKQELIQIHILVRVSIAFLRIKLVPHLSEHLNHVFGLE
jgi:hypothetical protein